MSEPELKELGEDIKKNGLTSPIVLWQADPKAPEQLLDGRNRLDAIELVTRKQVEIGAPSLMAGDDFFAPNRVVTLDKSVEPYAYVISANIRRRHLNVEERQHLLIELIARSPEKSNRDIARSVGVSHHTVGQARAKGEQLGRVAQLDKTIGKDRKARPTKRSTSPRRPAAKTTSPIGLGDELPVIDVEPSPTPGEVAPPPPVEKPECAESAAQPQSAIPNPSPAVTDIKQPIAETTEDDSESEDVRGWIAGFLDCSTTILGATRWIEKHRGQLSRADIDALRKCAEDVSNEALKLTSKLSDCATPGEMPDKAAP
jgi:hypothetical protein